MTARKIDIHTLHSLLTALRLLGSRLITSK